MAPDLIILDAKSKTTRIIVQNYVILLLGAGFVALPELPAAVRHEAQRAAVNVKHPLHNPSLNLSGDTGVPGFARPLSKAKSWPVFFQQLEAKIHLT